MKGQWPLMYPESGTPAEFKAAVLMWVVHSYCDFCENLYISDTIDADIHAFCPECLEKRGMTPAIPL